MARSRELLLVYLRSGPPAALLAASILASLPGCVPIPYATSEHIPDLSAYLPADLLERSNETLVLTQTSTRKEGLVQELSTPPQERTKRVVNALFLSGSGLRTLNQRLFQKSGAGVEIIFPLPPYPGGPVPFTESRTSLSRICVLSDDGREIGIDFTGSQPKSEFYMLYVGRRDAIVSALRGTDRFPFAAVAGPCAVMGDVDWTKGQRSRVADYVATLPRIELPAETEITVGKVQVPLLGADEASSAGFMLLAVSRSGPGAPRVIPFFIAQLKLADLVATLGSMMPREFALRMSSARTGVEDLIVGFRPDGLCLISAAGDTLGFLARDEPQAHESWWQPLLGPLKGEKTIEAWRNDAITALQVDDPENWNGETCWLGSHANWPRGLREAVIRFLERLPVESSTAKNGR